MKLGDYVKYRTQTHLEPFTRGRVVALEEYTDFQGTRHWIYVRWFNENDRPDSEPCKCTVAELQVLSE